LARLHGPALGQAQLQGAKLVWTDFREASLGNANLEQLIIKNDGEPGQERSTDLIYADFRDADLTDAHLATVTGLRAEMLAGAVLTNAKLPEYIKSFDQLRYVEETSRIASTVFFGLLAASLYSWLTIASTTDVALITGTSSSPLPIINTNIALSGFYFAAPLILIAVYFYFHLYLQRLWGALASLPAVFPDGATLDRKAYPWLLNGLVWAHFRKLEVGQRPLTIVENVVSVFLAWWVVPLTLLAFWLRFLPRHYWLGTWLHVFLITSATGFGVYSYRLVVQTLREGQTSATLFTQPSSPSRMSDRPVWARVLRAIPHYRPDWVSSTLLTLIMVLSLSAAVDPADPNERPVGMAAYLFSAVGYRTYADLTDDDVSTKPSGWTGRKETADVEIAQVKGADLEDRDLRNANASGAFLVNARLAGADLRGAMLWQADLRGADLERANLTGASLTRSNISDANLSRADLSAASLSHADLSAADLSGANLIHADLAFAKLRDADLSAADTWLGELLGRGFIHADLRGAKLIGADLSGAKLGNALHVTQAQLHGACGDNETQLPEGLTIWPCPVAAPPASLSPPGSS
jgi:uncharacterized protein YjbI with pentapeptide repeats